jgi:hypothetical protein
MYRWSIPATPQVLVNISSISLAAGWESIITFFARIPTTGRERFLPTSLGTLRFAHIRTREPNYWLWNLSYYPARDGLDCCSPQWISTHYVPPLEMRELHWAVAVGCEGA